MESSERAARAALRRGRSVLNRTKLGRAELDPALVSGAAAISLVHQLTRESWSVGGLAMPEYERHEIPVRFVPT